MPIHRFSHLLLAAAVTLAATSAEGFNLMAPGDPIIAIDLDFTIGSSSPLGEPVTALIDDDTTTKYLNFGGTSSGFIVTPSTATAVQSFTMVTANDAEGRDPASWVLYGTNDPITSAPHSNGREENWVEIAMGDLTLPAERFTLGDPVGFSNATSYSSYKMAFPTVKVEGNIFQLGEIDFYTSMDATGSSIFTPVDPIIPIRDVDPFPASNSPETEGAPNAIDSVVGTKYLNFGKEDSGFIVTPSYGAAEVNGIRFTTANDALARDPASWEIYGTNDEIVTENNGIGDLENWTLIDSGTVELPAERNTRGDLITVNNASGAFTSYRVVFPTLRDSANANSMQIAEVELISPDEATLEIDRQTGEAVLKAVDPVTFSSYEVRSADSLGIDAGGWSSLATSGADGNDTWEETSAESDLLAEGDTPGGADDGFSLSPGQEYSLGVIWQTLPSSFEDLAVDVRRTDGTRVGVGVEFVGTEIVPGDYDGNGSVGSEDWPLFRAGYGGDYTGLTEAEAYLGGDLDGDFDSDINDFNLFVAAAGGAAALFGVPEPGSLSLVALGAVLGGFGMRRRRQAVTVAAAACVAVVAGGNVASAQTFTNVGGVPTGITIPAGQENEDENSGPVNLFDDDFLDGAGVIDGELFNFDYSDPDFADDYLQYAGLGPDPKVVFFDYGSTVSANWFAYAQRSGAITTADRVGKFEFWFSNTDFGGALPGTDPDSVLEILPTDNRLRDSTLRPYTLGGEQSGRYVAVRFTASELSLTTSGTNNIGGSEFRLLSGPGDVVLEVNRATGQMTLSNNQSGATSLPIKSYAIESLGGGLDEAGFDGVAGDGSFPAGNGSGNGWETGGGSDKNRLVEAYFSSESTFGAGTSGISLGTGYNELTLLEDLKFTWTNADGYVYDGVVVYTGTPVDIFHGDYNDDGVVNAADYTVWRDALGTSTTLPNDVTPGFVDEDDYDWWASNFGAIEGAATSVPEPAGLMLVAIGAAFGLRAKRNTNR